MATLIRRLFCLYLVVNMSLVAILFFPWINERETFSGLIGRKFYFEGVIWLKPVVTFVNWLFRDETHCFETAWDEENVRHIWYAKHYANSDRRVFLVEEYKSPTGEEVGFRA